MAGFHFFRSKPVIRITMVVFVLILTSIVVVHDLHSRLIFHLLTSAAAAAMVITRLRRPRPVYLVDYACFLPGPDLRCPNATFTEHTHLLLPLSHDDGGRTARFMAKMLERGGIGDETSRPAGHHFVPVIDGLLESRAEAELVMFSAIDDLLAKTGFTTTTATIDVLVVNCAVFAPIPSLSDMIVRRYNLRDDLRCVNLSGMGCSAGLIAVGLAAGMLQQAGSRALVVSTEIITPSFYAGEDQSMQLSNALFRVGGAAVLLSAACNADAEKPRFRLRHVVRTTTGGEHDDSSSSSYNCVFQKEDAKGILGVKLSKTLPSVAADALKANLAAAFGSTATDLIRTAFDHVCVHAGGRAVIDEVRRSLGMSEKEVEASRMALRRFGNTSSSSVWYELAYMEAKGRVRRGHRVWMIGFGSGFKCNSAVWDCIRPAREPDKAWAGCIHRYPPGPL